MSASETESFLTGQHLNSEALLQEAARRLSSEVAPQEDPHQGSVEYRRDLVTALLYKVRKLGRDLVTAHRPGIWCRPCYTR